jgi:hypothetical protein
VVDSIDVFILARTTRPEELAFLRAHVSPAGLGAARALPAREFMLAERGGEAVTFVAPPRVTSHVRHLGKYTDRPVAPHHRFTFRHPVHGPVAVAATLGEFAAAVASVDEAVLAHHAGGGDFSRWIGDVFDDRQFCRHLRKVEQRWARGEIGDVRQALRQPLDALTADRAARPEDA